MATLTSVSLGTIAASSYPAGVGATFAGDASYVASAGSALLTITAASQTISFPALSNQTYGAADYTIAGTASSGLAVSFSATGACSVAAGTSTVHLTGAGSCTVTASQAGNGNYSAATPVKQSFSIAKATLVISVDNKAKVYGTANPTFTYTASGLANKSDTISGVSFSTTAVTNSPVGSYNVTASGASVSGSDAASYTIAYRTGTLAVVQATLKITANSTSKVYGTSNPAFSYTISGLTAGDTITNRSDVHRCVQHASYTRRPLIARLAITRSRPVKHWRHRQQRLRDHLCERHPDGDAGHYHHHGHEQIQNVRRRHAEPDLHG